MTEETFGPTLPIMKVATPRRRCGWPTTRPTASARRCSRATPSAARRSRGGCEAGAANVNDAMINYTVLELPMGGAKASGLGSRHGAGGIRKYCSQQAIVVTPRLALKREPHMYPYKAPHLAAARGPVQVPVRARQARLSARRCRPRRALGRRVGRSAQRDAEQSLELGDRRLGARVVDGRHAELLGGREVEGQVVDVDAALGARRRRARRRARTCGARACGCPPRRRSRRRRTARRTARAGSGERPRSSTRAPCGCPPRARGGRRRPSPSSGSTPANSPSISPSGSTLEQRGELRARSPPPSSSPVSSAISSSRASGSLRKRPSSVCGSICDAHAVGAGRRRTGWS